MHGVVAKGGRSLEGFAFRSTAKCLDDADGAVAQSARGIEIPDEHDLGIDLESERSRREHAIEKARAFLFWSGAAVTRGVGVRRGGETFEMGMVGGVDLGANSEQLSGWSGSGERAAECPDLRDGGWRQTGQPNLCQ